MNKMVYLQNFFKYIKQVQNNLLYNFFNIFNKLI